MLFGKEKDLVPAPGVGFGAPPFSCVLTSTAAASTTHYTLPSFLYSPRLDPISGSFSHQEGKRVEWADVSTLGWHGP